ncbi:MAG: ATP-binding protein, partial [Dehalococcoidia bacterium]
MPAIETSSPEATRELIRSLRARQHLTQAELAQALGTTVLSVNRWENAQANPSARMLRRLEQYDRDHPATVPAPREPAGSLPGSRTAFIGREDEVERMIATLPADGTRLLTLTGTGGIGKTRMAMAVAERVCTSFPDGISVLELGILRAPGDVLPALAELLGLMEGPRRPLLDAVIDVLRERTALLLLDNCEHLVETCASLVASILSHCPTVKILATSREPLNVAGELRWPVPPLAFPSDASPPRHEELARFDAVRLFMERARSRRPDLTLDEETGGAVAEICRRLHGLPLAIELAAARTGSFSPGEIAARLGGRLTLLVGNERGAPERQRTLRATLDWSYDLLSDMERGLLARLSVFRGSFSLEAIEAIGGSLATNPIAIDCALESLADKSLVVVSPATATRYHLLETIQLYAAEKLDPAEVEELRERHARFFLQYAERAAPELIGPRQTEWHLRLEGEQENLRAALDWAWQTGEGSVALQLVGVLGRHWLVRGFSTEGKLWCERALEVGREASAEQRALALRTFASLVQRDGDRAAADVLIRRALVLARQADAKPALADCTYLLGHILLGSNLIAAGEALQESVRFYQQIGDRRGAAAAAGSAALAGVYIKRT